MNRRNNFIKIFNDSFKMSRQWSDWFINEVYADDNLLTLDVDDKTVSVLLMTPYSMAFHGIDLQASYLSCVATAIHERGKGYMSKLMRLAVESSYNRGDVFAMLIPETRRLYFFYDRFGFATVFYADEQRYTSVHTFTMGDDYDPVEPTYAIFEPLERLNEAGVRHTATDFKNVMRDLSLDGGQAVAVSSPSGSSAMAFVTSGREAVVKALLATDDDAAEAALAVVRNEVGDKPVVVNADPGDRISGLQARGMIRIINVEKVLTALAAAFPDLKTTIRVRDDLIEDNNGVYALSSGRCLRTDVQPQKVNLDVNVAVLAQILFSASKVSEIFNIPGARPIMHLMLE